MRLHMVTRRFKASGNTFGYGVLVDAMHRELQALGVVFDDTAPLALAIEPPIGFRGVPGKPTVVYSMWESEWEFPPSLRPHLDEAALIVVPCRWNVGIFEAVTRVPVVTCPLGIDAAAFPYVAREWRKGTPFQWLYCGAPNARKGFDVIQDAWRPFYGRTDMRLYAKTSSGADEGRAIALAEGWQETGDPYVLTHGNVTVDMRRLPVADLARLYHQSHGHLYPTGAEGWGLVAHEVLATGCPTIATDFGGHLDFLTSEFAVLLPWKPVASHLETALEVDGRTLERYQLTSAYVEPIVLASAMIYTMRHYRAALRRARRGSQHVRQLTWRRTAERLLRILHDVAVQQAA